MFDTLDLPDSAQPIEHFKRKPLRHFLKDLAKHPMNN
jgi:hypothetical protein